jgi:lysophosphatidylcholine acyltransferase/lyso-PAF acetyltransferase
VEYLPVVVPTLKEIRDPHEYADRVRRMMASHLGVSCTDHNFVDVRLALAARKLQQPAGQSLVEFACMEKLFHLNFATAQDYLTKFSDMDHLHRYQAELQYPEYSPRCMLHPGKAIG